VAFLSLELDESESKLLFSHAGHFTLRKKNPLHSALILRPSCIPENMSANKKEYITSDISLRINGLK